MGLNALLHAVALFWLVLHAARYVAARRHHRSSTSALPLPLLSSARRGVTHSSKSVKVTLHHAYLRVETARYNDLHDRTTLALSKNPYRRLRRVLEVAYDVGNGVGLLGMLGALALVGFSAVRSFTSLVNSPAVTTSVGSVHPGVHSFAKRNLEELPSTGQAPSSAAFHGDAPLNLIIPGVTVPLSHLPLLLLALFVAQVLHELGHALCAALDSVPLLSTGFSLTVILPSAFVSLSSGALSTLSHRGRARVACAGAWHNLLLYLLLVALARVGCAGILWSLMGFEDVGQFGRVVLGTDLDSPLHHSLPEGSVIVSLDDLRLTSSDASVDLWTSYLSRTLPSSTSEELGWCIDREWFLSQPSTCCTPTEHGASGSAQACFLAASAPTERCLPTLSVLLPSRTHASGIDDSPRRTNEKRCTLSADCGAHRLCVSPRSDEELVRIGVWSPASSDAGASGAEDGDERLVIWSGPREEILEEVRVGVYRPRTVWLPLWLPVLLGTFFEYIATLSLSLYFFNLLPLPYLDGSTALEAFLDILLPSSSLFRADAAEDDLEEGSTNSRQRASPWTTLIRGSTMSKKRIADTARWATVALCVSCVVLGALRAVVGR